MTGRKTDLRAAITEVYAEESVKPAILAMLVLLVLLAAPLGWFIHKIGSEGFRAADTTSYSTLVEKVDMHVGKIQRLLRQEAMDEVALKASIPPMVKLITPDIMQTNLEETVNQGSPGLNVELTGIYWSPNPLSSIVTLGGESYRVGERINGYKIVEIRKTEVVFKDPWGEPVVKYFYDYLGKPKQK